MKSLIRNSNQTKQGIDFTGIQNGKIHPTDIDAVLEFNNEALILIEVKKIKNDLPTGQRLVLERICNSWHTHKSIVLFVTHNFTDETKDIPLYDCNVEKYFFAGKWHVVSSTLKSTLNKIGENWNINKLKI